LQRHGAQHRREREEDEQPRPLVTRHPADDQFRRHVRAQRHLHAHPTHHRFDRVVSRERGLVLHRRAVHLDAIRIGHDCRAERVVWQPAREWPRKQRDLLLTHRIDWLEPLWIPLESQHGLWLASLVFHDRVDDRARHPIHRAHDGGEVLFGVIDGPAVDRQGIEQPVSGGGRGRPARGFEPLGAEIVAERVADELHEFGGGCLEAAAKLPRRWEWAPRRSGFGAPQRVQGRHECDVPELLRQARSEARGGHACIVPQHALGGGPVIEEGAVRLQREDARQPQREQQQGGDE